MSDVVRYTGWEMFPLGDNHRNDGNVYVRAFYYDELAARLAEALLESQLLGVRAVVTHGKAQ